MAPRGSSRETLVRGREAPHSSRRTAGLAALGTGQPHRRRPAAGLSCRCSALSRLTLLATERRAPWAALSSAWTMDLRGRTSTSA